MVPSTIKGPDQHLYTGLMLSYTLMEILLSQSGTTQGDPLAMGIYAIATVPLIERVANDGVRQTWYADDATAGDDLANIKKWWDNLQMFGPDYIWLLPKSDIH